MHMCSIAASADLTAPVNRIIRFSSVDGPGNRTAVFLQGCCFTCKYCHNPETINTCVTCGKCVSHCPAGALSIVSGIVHYDPSKCCLCDTCIRVCEHMASPRIRMLSVDQVMSEIRLSVPFIRGVTVSGGECTLHRDFCLELAKACRAENLNFLLDSNGSLDFELDSELTNAIDGVMLDVKAWDEEKHVSLTGCSAGIVQKNLRFLAKQGKLEEVRTVVIPGESDPLNTVTEVSRILAEFAPATRYKLIRYRPMGVREPYRSHIVPPDDNLMSQVESIAHSFGITNTVLL